MAAPRRPRRPASSRRSSAAAIAALSARAAGLSYASDCRPGIRRVRHGATFRYFTTTGRRLTDRQELERIPRAGDSAGMGRCVDLSTCAATCRRQGAMHADEHNRYHPNWRAVRDNAKFDRMIAFAQALPRIRRRTAADVRRVGMTRKKVIALIVQLLEKTLIRVGNDEYAKQNRSSASPMLRDRHVDAENGSRVTFTFRGNRRRPREGARRPAPRAPHPGMPRASRRQGVPVLRRRRQPPDGGLRRHLRVSKTITGGTGTHRTLLHVGGDRACRAVAPRRRQPSRSQAEARRNAARAIEGVSKQLGNTKAVCRKSYVHPDVLDAELHGSLLKVTEKDPELTVLALLLVAALRGMSAPRELIEGARRGWESVALEIALSSLES